MVKDKVRVVFWEEGIKAVFNFIPLDTSNPQPIIIDDGLSIEYIKENDHPLSGVLIYKVNTGGKQVIYATDVECPNGFDRHYLEFIKGVDILIHDSQYFDDDYHSTESPKKGFGHSTVSMAASNALKAEVNELYLFHYSPEYTDDDVEKMLAQAREIFKNTYLSEELKKINLRR